jgi:hypothetical protein
MNAVPKNYGVFNKKINFFHKLDSRYVDIYVLNVKLSALFYFLQMQKVIKLPKAA